MSSSTQSVYTLRSLLTVALEPSYELTFYERAQDPNDELHAIKPYIPNFLGVKDLKGQKYLVMNDLLAPYKSPGCIDIKIGMYTVISH